MKKGFWLTALIFAGLGIFFYLFVYGYQFTGILLCACAAALLILGFLAMLAKKIFSIIFTCLLCLILVAMIGTGMWIHKNMPDGEVQQAKYVVVLGAGVNDNEPSKSLAERIEAAADYAKAYPDAILVLSGGKSAEDSISEAQCMYNELIARGIPASRLLKEENATTTEENLHFAVELIKERTGKVIDKIGVISSEYHIPRASLIAEELGLEMLGIPAETDNFLYFCNMFVREIFAVWKEIF